MISNQDHLFAPERARGDLASSAVDIALRPRAGEGCLADRVIIGDRTLNTEHVYDEVNSRQSFHLDPCK